MSTAELSQSDYSDLLCNCQSNFSQTRISQENMNVILSDLITLGPEFNYFNLMQTDYLRRPPGAVSIININIQMIISQEPFIEIDPTLYQECFLHEAISIPLQFGIPRWPPCAGVPVYLAPWTGCPRGARQPWTGCPPGGNVSADILPPTLVISPPGATYPGWFILPPGGEDKPAGLSCPPP